MGHSLRRGSAPLQAALRLIVAGLLLLFLTAGVGKRCLYALSTDVHDSDSRAPVLVGRPPPSTDQRRAPTGVTPQKRR